MKHTFTLEYWQDDDWFVGKLKEVPGVFSLVGWVRRVCELNVGEGLNCAVTHHKRKAYTVGYGAMIVYAVVLMPYAP